MEADESRSREVIEGYKRHKLAVSAFRRIRDLLRGFERERAADRRLAMVGMTLLVLALLVYLGIEYFDSGSMVVPRTERAR